MRNTCECGCDMCGNIHIGICDPHGIVCQRVSVCMFRNHVSTFDKTQKNRYMSISFWFFKLFKQARSLHKTQWSQCRSMMPVLDRRSSNRIWLFKQITLIFLIFFLTFRSQEIMSSLQINQHQPQQPPPPPTSTTNSSRHRSNNNNHHQHHHHHQRSSSSPTSQIGGISSSQTSPKGIKPNPQLMLIDLTYTIFFFILIL